tara:strand:+ start:3599 stop:3802 length:204 start_codon:yes stop_codon:yes gene_type:complete
MQHAFMLFVDIGKASQKSKSEAQKMSDASIYTLKQRQFNGRNMPNFFFIMNFSTRWVLLDTIGHFGH